MNPSLRGPLLGFTLFALLICGWLYYRSDQLQTHYAQTAVPWMKDALWEISSWHSDDLWPLLAPEAQAVISREQLDSVMAQYSPLGRYVAMNEPRFSRLASILSLMSSGTRIGYSALVEFESGEAVVTLTLLERDGRFYIYNINLGPA